MTAGKIGRTVATVDVALIGATGRVGRRVLDLIATRQDACRCAGIRPRLVAVANSRRTLIARDGIAPDVAVALLQASEPPQPGAVALAEALVHLASHPLIIIDCTASADIAAHYPRWLAAGIDVVTPNKIASSADRPLAHALAAAQAASGTRLWDSTTVGAQLPLLATLRDLHRAGDRIERFEAVLSGTLSFVLGSVKRGAALSAAVREAVQTGYAEPNPACDLSGEDAARKLVILLRALGHDLQLRDVDCVALVDAGLLREDDPARLLTGLEAADEGWRARAALAEARHERWVYRASFENGRARVAPERVAESHAFARLAPCENALILHSAFYHAAPLTIAGPGAGIELTAAGVFADLVAAAQRRPSTHFEVPVVVAA
jgi:bifunctional aspartokinase / homoserine dehydrogenase 1